MQFNSHATSQDIVSEIDTLCDSDSTSYPIASKTRRVNSAYEELVAMIINADATWQFDDTNHTDAPRGKATLIEGQEYYTFDADYLQIEAIDVLNKANLYQSLKPIDPHDLDGQTLDEYFGVDSSGNPNTGISTHYDIKGDSMRLYPAPTASEVTLADGLRVSFKRTVDLFTTTDTTQEPGLPSTHHIMLAYMASIPFCMSYKKDRVKLYEKKVDEMKKTLVEHYSYREKNRRGIITTKRRSFR